MKSTSFNFSTFPQLQADISEIKDILRDVFKKPMEDIPKAFNTNQAIEYIRNKGVPMSRSRLYKLSSGNKDFPVHYIGGRLLFYSQEIDTWVAQQIVNRNNNESETLRIAQSVKN